MGVRVYLAGPEVFLPNAREIGARKGAICERHGLVGVFPADEEDACDPALPLPEWGLAISRAMERVMRGCDAMIVNLTPFPVPRSECRCRLGV
jgi:nucleoside 2-deoxyribosyltransferase